MNTESEVRTAPSINGHMIALGAGHSIAIYERNGECHVAEFRGGCGSLEYASSWFRLHAGAMRWNAALRSSMPLNPEMLEKIERLHAASDAPQAKMLAVLGSVAAAARRNWINAISRLRGRTARVSQTLG